MSERDYSGWWVFWTPVGKTDFVAQRVASKEAAIAAVLMMKGAVRSCTYVDAYEYRKPKNRWMVAERYVPGQEEDQFRREMSRTDMKILDEAIAKEEATDDEPVWTMGTVHPDLG